MTLDQPLAHTDRLDRDLRGLEHLSPRHRVQRRGDARPDIALTDALLRIGEPDEVQDQPDDLVSDLRDYGSRPAVPQLIASRSTPEASH
ncbi:MAG: hypothetical protein IR158_17525 [Cellulomonas sp.]|uniref:hypothetical protein n=1 Tax=Cellulomonas sp. TaxID=40001 RepID=UPI0019E4DE55|nr:hypothetical protein [Cellulomonas sp.]MBF0689553.1 hypothetical protein [Cellulomonas sp.]